MGAGCVKENSEGLCKRGRSSVYLVNHLLKQLQAPEVKLQIITLAAKLITLNPSNDILILLTRYALSLARYDTNYDVRDRARMLSSLLIGVLPKSINGSTDEGIEERGGVVLRREQVRLVLFDGKAAVVEPQTSSDEHALLGSLALVTGKTMASDAVLPDWLEEGTESTLRDTEDDRPVSVMPAVPVAPAAKGRLAGTPVVLTPSPAGSLGAGGNGGAAAGKTPWMDLDKFYEDTEEVEESESEEEEEEGDSEDEDEAEGEEEVEGEEDGPGSGDESEEASEDESETESQGKTASQQLSITSPAQTT